MGTITGNLETMQLAELLQWLAQGRKTGTLVVVHQGIAKKIYFRDGRIISSSSNDPKEHLGHFLVSHGYITEEQLATAVALQEKEKKLFGRLLVDMGVITGEELDRMLRLKAEKGIFGLFRWSEGEFRFLNHELPSYEMVSICLDVTTLILEATRWLDEHDRIQRVIPSYDAIPVSVVDDLTADETLVDADRHVLRAVNDDRSVEEIALHVHASEHHVCETLYRCAEARKLKIVRPRVRVEHDVDLDASSLARRARDLATQKRYEQALRHAQAATALEPDNEELESVVVTLEEEAHADLEQAGLVGTLIPHLNVSFEELTSLSVSPKAGFILSRVNGSYDIDSILKISPMTPLEALLVLDELRQAGHIRLESQPGSTPA